MQAAVRIVVAQQAVKIPRGRGALVKPRDDEKQQQSDYDPRIIHTMFSITQHPFLLNIRANMHA